MFSYINPIPTLADYPGPVRVGTTEIEIPISEVPSPSSVPDPAITTIKFRVFYPTTQSAKSAKTAWWLPEPQQQWLEAYALFMGASPSTARIVSYSPNPIKHTSIPAVPDAEVLPPEQPGTKYPVLIFSHGLGGSCNAYSSILGALASCGAVCIAPEHRDQSCPVSIIRGRNGKPDSSIDYLSLSHNFTPDVYTARNVQLRIRLWELELVYSAISALNKASSTLTNLAHNTTPSFANLLDLTPGDVTWCGHSFGAASIVQFTKSVFWHQSLPEPTTDPEVEHLYNPTANSALSRQITPSSPIVLLDLWAMPLRGPATQWLYDKPLPCWTLSSNTPTNSTIAIMSEEFFKWPELLARTKAILSESPSQCGTTTDDNGDGTKNDTSTADDEGYSSSSSPSPSSSTTSLPPPSSSPAAAAATNPPRLFYAPKTAHLSQSDFGPLFPWVTGYLLGIENAERTISYNVRAVLQGMRERGVRVEGLNGHEDDGIILETEGKVEGWVRVSLDS